MGKARDEAGNIWETDAQGNPVRLLQPAGASQMPADPSFPYEGPKAAAEVRRAQAQATVAEAEAPYAASVAQAEAAKANAEAEKARVEALKIASGRETTAEGREKAIRGFQAARALSDRISEIEELYKQGPGATGFPGGLIDYFPTADNKRFNNAGQRTRALIKDVLGFTGTESNTPLESQLNYNPYIPSAGNWDSEIEDKIAALRDLENLAYSRVAAQLGGLPDASGKVVPVPQGTQLNAMTVPRLISGAASQAAGAGATTTIDQLPPEMQQEHAAFLQQWMGNPDPQAYAAFRTELDRKYGYTGDPQEYLAGGQKMAEAIRSGGATIDPNIPGIERDLSGVDQLRNSVVSNPLGAAVVGAADMGSFGGVSALAPEQMGALAASQPLAMTGGQIVGAITGTGALGRLGKETVGRALPGLLGGGSKAQFGRNLATDVAYSGAYGGISGEGAGETALEGGAGSILGQTVGKGLGTVLGGARVAPAVEALRARGIPMTVPQQLGGFAKAVEDRATSMPFVGDMIARRRMEGLTAFNREALGEAGRPIGFNPDTIGKEGVEQLTDAVGNYYDNATAGVTVPLDGDFIADMGKFGRAAERLPDDLRPRAGLAIQNRVAPISDAGQMTGEQYQQAMRGLKGYKAETVKPGFEGDYRDALSLAQDALTNQMRRGGGESVIEGLDNANAAYRGIKTVEDAAMRADGAGYLFTPSQLQDALKKTQRKYPGQSPLNELADQGQEVLPSRIPDSGTAGRFSQMLVPGGMIGAGTGLGAYSGGMEGAQDGAVLSTLATLALLAGGTKGGQKALEGAIFARPEKLRQLAQGINKRRGMFGSAALPLAYGN